MRKIYLALIALTITPIVGAQVLFSEDFDAGIGAWTITDNLSDGNTWKASTANGGLDGTGYALVDSDADGNGIWMIESLTSAPFDATLGGPVVLLDFDQFFRQINSGDSVRVDVFDGVVWNTVYSYVGTGTDLGAWAAPDHQTIDISAHINANMQIRFHFDDNNVWAWWWAVDNVVVSSLLADDVGVTAVLNTSGFGLTATENVDINVVNFGSSPASAIPVYYSVNGGPAVGPELVPGPIAPLGNANYTFTATADLSVPGPYSIVAWTEFVGDGDIMNDTSSVDIISAVNAVVTLPLCLDFENATDVTVANGLANNLLVGSVPEVIFDSGTDGVGGFGRIRTLAGPGYSQSGTHALTIDRTTSGGNIANYVRIHLDMSSYDATTDLILLDYSIMEHGDEVNPEDSVWIRGSDTDSWIGVADWNTLTGGANGVYFTDSDIDISTLLNANAQNFSTTFEIRFGQNDNFESTSTTASDGMTIDDVCLRQLLNTNAAPIAVISPTMDNCGSDMMQVCATFENLGADTLFTMPVTLNWTDGANSGSEIVTYTDTLLFNEFDTVCFTPINSTSGGTFTFEIITGLVGDQDMNDDTLSVDVDIVDVTIDIDTTHCIASGDSLSLAANVLVLDATYTWYDSLVGGSIIFVGDTLFTGPLTSDTSYFVESSAVTTFTIGAPDIAIGASGTYSNYPDGLLFDVATPIVIDSLTIYPESAGDVVVRLLDNLGTEVTSVTVTIAAPAVAFDPVRIGVNLPVGIGTGWQLDGVGTTVTQMMRNSSGGAYPYSEPGVMDITGAINALAGYYYFWYDWQVSTGGCPSIRTEVAVGINPTVTPADPGADVCEGDAAVTLLAGTPPAGTFSGPGVTGSQFDPAVAGVGTHTITYTYMSATGCSGSADTTITVEAAPVVTAAVPGTDSLCVFEAAITLGEGTPAGGTFSGTGVTGNQFDPSTAGAGTHTITYSYTSGAGCIGSADVTIVVDACASIDELGLAVDLYPNPATDILNIELEGNFTYDIVDTKGAIITSGKGFNSVIVKTTSFQAGVYFVNIATDNGTATSKLIVQ